jgi:hypothetical protein
MKVIRIEDLNLIVPETSARGGIEYYEIVEGRRGTPSNFSLVLATAHPGYYAPRHKHNFEQVRLLTEGAPLEYDDLGETGLGSVGYFPEGTSYGPQSSPGRSQTLLLQYGGPSLQGYMSFEEYREHFEALRGNGKFEKGVYTWYDENEVKHNRDGYEAVWSHWAGRKLKYPNARYRSPFLMDPEKFDWLQERPGVWYRHLGAFGWPCTVLDMIHLDAGAQLELQERSIYFVRSGSGKLPTSWSRYSTVYLEEGESGSIKADADSDLFYIGLPNLTSLSKLEGQEPMFAH